MIVSGAETSMVSVVNPVKRLLSTLSIKVSRSLKRPVTPVVLVIAIVPLELTVVLKLPNEVFIALAETLSSVVNE